MSSAAFSMWVTSRNAQELGGRDVGAGVGVGGGANGRRGLWPHVLSHRSPPDHRASHRSSSRALYGCAKVLQQDDQLQGISRRRLERGIKAPVEACRLCRLRMNQQGASTDPFGHCGRLHEGIADKLPSKPLPLIPKVDAQPSQDDDRDGMSPGAGCETWRSKVRLDGACRERVVASHPPLSVWPYDVDPGGICLLGQQRISAKPVRLCV